MNRTVVVSAEAEADLANAVAWYEEEAPEQVGRLLEEFDSTMRRIARFPNVFPTVRRDARRVQVRVFPYQLWFRLRPRDSVVEVLALVHVRQDRAGFSGRLP